MYPTILAAKVDLIEAIGEFHDLKGVADAIRGADRDAVTGAGNADHGALVGDDLGVVVVDNNAPTGSVVEPIGTTQSPIGRTPKGISPSHGTSLSVIFVRFGWLRWMSLSKLPFQPP